ncbi:T9SS type A sorting domain-containing protein [Spirosoma litoris]
MNYGKLLVVLFAVRMLLNPVFAQKIGSSTPGAAATYPLSLSIAGTKIKYYKDDRDAFSRVPAPEAFLKRQSSSGRLAPQTAQFIVTYTNFTQEAQKAFQYAVDIWSTLIVSSVPIRIQANWVSDEPNLLGSAGPTSYRYNFDGGQKATAFYPIALAEKIAHKNLNGLNEADIVADFNRNNQWYFGTDGLTPAGQTDMVTVVLHELAHGLGFIGFFNVTDFPGDMNNGQYLAALPSIYDCFIETGGAGGPKRRLVTSQDVFPNNSIPLNRQLTGNDLFLNGAVLQQTTGQKLRVHAKSTFSRASSIYHLDEDTYPPGNINSLMTPKLGLAESIHSPGINVLKFFSDLEWKTTSVLHDPIANTEDAKDLVFSTRIISDTTLIAGSMRLVYRKTAPAATDSAATTVSLIRVGTTDTYQYTLPAAQAQGDIWYYFQAQDASGRTFSNPGKQLAGGQIWNHVKIGPDNVPPTIQYAPAKTSIFSTAVADSLPIYARIADDRAGISSAYVDYQINGVSQSALPLSYNRLTIGNYTYDSVYVNRINFPANSLKVGDKITYRIVAQDGSRAKNQTTNPSTGFYQLTVVATKAVRDQYVNTFNDGSTASDFAGYGFTVTTPASFGDGAIHSTHPYPNGTDFQSQSNYDYTLLTPIRIKANPDSAIIRFDEIVLVEPGATGSRLGDSNFYDYVVVEGSSNNGQTWKPLLDAYSANARTEWLTAYNSDLVTGLRSEKNSKAGGFPAMYRRREIPLLNQTTGFKAGDQLLIRFRLFADPLSYGWGWAIDNLFIQTPVPLILAEGPIREGSFKLYPNPVSNGTMQLEAELLKPTSELGLTISSLTGQPIRQLTLKVNGKQISEQLDVGQLPAGLYLMQLKVGDSIQTKKVIIAK